MRFVWTLEKLKIEALEYRTRGEFQLQNKSAYHAALKLQVLNLICAHMPKTAFRSRENHPNFKWSLKKLHEEALKYKNRIDFQKNSDNAYQAAYKRGLLDDICSHMNDSVTAPWPEEELKKEALKYNLLSDFIKNSPAAYKAAWRRKIINILCSHMKKLGGPSIPEKSLFDIIKAIHPKTQTFKVRAKKNRIFIENKPHIQGFDIDIYIPELRKGIEFNGKYWHSVEGLKRSREHWPIEDLVNYNKIKSNYFMEKHNIEIFHVDGEDWEINKQACIDKCLEFLESKKCD